MVGSQLSALMISPQKENLIGKVYFECKEDQKNLDPINPSVNIVS